MQLQGVRPGQCVHNYQNDTEKLSGRKVLLEFSTKREFSQ